MIEKQTKEQLVIEIAKLEQAVKEYSDASERRRKEFAKAFGWYEQTYYSSYNRPPKLPSWEEIFVEIGKLLASKKESHFNIKLPSFEEMIRDMEGNKGVKE